jgi:dolichyl-phosphate-mannose--protein O-mannosyl transferase
MKILQENRDLFLYSLAVLIIAVSTYFMNYYNPSAVFWDENYHIASAQKYLEGVMYMEPHPPLGKLFIALGEWLIHPNDTLDTAYFLDTNYIKKFPAGYSFVGVRLFPTIFATLSAVVFFLILFRLSKNMDLSFLFTSFYLFANAFILHSRAAMLEPTQIFFIFLAILYFLILLEREKKGVREYFILGLLIGLALAVKVNSLILILLYPFLFFYRLGTLKGYIGHIIKFVVNAIAFGAGIMLIFLSVFYIHFSLGSKVGKITYNASPKYLEVIKKGEQTNLSNFLMMAKENLVYEQNYQKGVPRYNPCKKVENGSLAMTWPFGNKPINYRWSKKDGKVSYLYLQSNPIIWFSVVLGVILALVLVISRFVYGLHVKDERLFYLICVFLALYVSYMIVVFNIGRVMYLYHYFIPLFFGAFIFFLMFNYLFKESIENRSKVLQIAVIIFVIEIVYTYYVFAPFTYFKPLTTMEFIQRQWFDFWHLKPIL